MFRRSIRRRGAWLALLALLSSLLAPLGAHARIAPDGMAHLLGAVCTSPGGAGDAPAGGPPARGEEAPSGPAGPHAGQPGCAACPCAPAALPIPAAGADATGTDDGFARGAAPAAPARVRLASAPPLPARGPPMA